MTLDGLNEQDRTVWKAFAYLVLRGQPTVDDSCIYAYSGFFVEHGTCLLWITAGHCIENIDNALAEYPNASFAFVPISERKPIFFNYRDSERHLFSRLPSELAGVGKPISMSLSKALRTTDVAFIRLGDHYADHVRSSAAVPFAESQYANVTMQDLSAYKQVTYRMLLYGVPESGYVLDAATPSLTLKSLPVDLFKTGDRMYTDWPTQPPRFLLKPDWSPSQHSGSIRGMSGGPIVFLGLNEPKLIGVVSSEIGTGGSPRGVVGVYTHALLQIVRRR